MKTIDILLVDDYVALSQGMEMLLLQHPKVATVHYCKNREDTLDTLRNNNVRILMLDLNLGTNKYDGTTIAKEVRALFKNVKIIIFSENIRPYLYQTLIKPYNIEAYIDKESDKTEIFNAIDELLNGNTYLDKNIRSILTINKWMKVSSRQKQVLSLLTKGLVHKQIAPELGISIKTVENHIARLRSIFNAKTTSELIKLYIEYKTGNKENSGDKTPPFKAL